MFAMGGGPVEGVRQPVVYQPATCVVTRGTAGRGLPAAVDLELGIECTVTAAGDLAVIVKARGKLPSASRR